MKRPFDDRIPSPKSAAADIANYLRVCHAVDPSTTRALLVLPLSELFLVPVDALFHPYPERGTVAVFLDEAFQPDNVWMWECEEDHHSRVARWSTHPPKTSKDNRNGVLIDPNGTASECYGLIGPKAMKFPVLYLGLPNILHMQNFVVDCNSLRVIDFRGMINLVEIGPMCVCRCRNLEWVDMRGLTNLKTIGANFLSDCENLTHVDLSGLTKVTLIGNSFLAQCPKLQLIDLSGLQNVEVIGSKFLKASAIEFVDLKPLAKVTSIGGFFLANCVRLQSVYLDGFEHVQSIGSNFLDGCVELMTVDCRKMKDLVKVGYPCLQGCSSLRYMDLRGLRRNLFSITSPHCEMQCE
jgi:hypothetical protein